MPQEFIIPPEVLSWSAAIRRYNERWDCTEVTKAMTLQISLFLWTQPSGFGGFDAQ